MLAAFSDVYGHLRKASFDQDSATRLVQDYEAYMLQQVRTVLFCWSVFLQEWSGQIWAARSLYISGRSQRSFA